MKAYVLIAISDDDECVVHPIASGTFRDLERLEKALTGVMRDYEDRLPERARGSLRDIPDIIRLWPSAPEADPSAALWFRFRIFESPEKTAYGQN